MGVMSEPQIPVLISLALMGELFGVATQTAYRWNTASGGREKMLPEPTVKVGTTPLWSEEVLIEWACSRGMKWDEDVLTRIRGEQNTLQPA
jgi:hypothetical protein